ncbi:MAG: lysine--tRNA ligase [Nanoarchaeota archaeon]
MQQKYSDSLIKERERKLSDLRKKGINPYAYSFDQKDHSKDLLEKYKHLDKETKTKDLVSVAGRIVQLRGMGKATFMHLQDQFARIQIYFREDDVGKQAYSLIKLLDIGDIIGAKGTIFTTKTGEISVYVKDFSILTKGLRQLPEKWHGIQDVEERYRKRYLDMIMNPSVKQRLLLRTKIITELRAFFNERGFVEVETPTLQAIYGGGFAKPFVTHHNELKNDFYLRISDEMYLKRILVGGIEKVYEITKVFRNEGIDFDHNPEFTMFEAQIAYKDYKYGMDLIEELFEAIAKKLFGTTKIKFKDHTLDVKRPWKRYKLVEAVEKFSGIDPLKWKTKEEAKSAIKKMNIPKEKLAELDKMSTVGEMIAFVFEEIVEDKLIQPVIIYDYPVEVSPLAKRCIDERFTQRFEVFAFGSEIGNNYSELNDPQELSKRFIEEKKKEEAGFEEAQQTDYEYLEAIEYGFPPACGLGIGVDRMIMLFTDAVNIKEVMFFPTLKLKKF